MEMSQTRATAPVAHGTLESGLTASLNASLEAAAGEEPDAVGTAELCDQAVAMRGAIDRLEAELSRRLAVVERRAGYLDEGYPNLTAFLKHRCRMSSSKAQHTASMARAMAEMPIGAKLWASGEISTDQAVVLARTRDAEPNHFDAIEAMLCEIAREDPWVEHLVVAARHWRHAIAVGHSGGAALEQRLRDQRTFHASRTWEGMVRVDGWLDPDAGTTFLDALEAATPPPVAGDNRTPGQRRADALIDLATNSVGRGRPHLQVDVPFDRLAHGTGAPATTAFDSTPLTDTALRRHACDATVSRIVLGPDSRPLDVGRTHRVVPWWICRAVERRDHHCRFPGCDRPRRWTDAHHIRHWIDRGDTSVDNLVLLCRHHHSLIHGYQWSMSGTATDLRIDSTGDRVHLGERRHPRSTTPSNEGSPGLRRPP